MTREDIARLRALKRAADEALSVPAWAAGREALAAALCEHAIALLAAAEEAIALRDVLKRALEERRADDNGFACPVCHNVMRYQGMPILPCVCDPGDSWVRDAVTLLWNELRSQR